MMTAAPLVLSQEVKSLVRDLAAPRGVAWQKASSLLREMPPEVVVPEIGRALREDPLYTTVPARFGVYEFLGDVVKDRRKQNLAVERPFLEQLKAGLAESDSGLRSNAVEGPRRSHRPAVGRRRESEKAQVEAGPGRGVPRNRGRRQVAFSKRCLCGR
jgi:hypothetical protein